MSDTVFRGWLLVALTGCAGEQAQDAAARRHALGAAQAGLVEVAPAVALGGEAAASRRAIDAAWAALQQTRLGFRLTAEHEETPRSLVLHIQSDDPVILRQQVELMQHVPAAVTLRLVVGSPAVEQALRGRLQAHPALAARCELIPLPSGLFSSVWARDFATGDETYQVVPLFHRAGLMEMRPTPAQPRNEVVELLRAHGTEIVRAPVYFAGGNVAVGKARDGRRLLFCGTSDWLATEAAYAEAGYRITENVHVAVLRALFAIDDVVLLGPRGESGEARAQAEDLFHLDQAMLFVGDGAAVVHAIEGGEQLPDERAIHRSWRRTLLEFARRWNVDRALADVELGDRLPLDPRQPRGDAQEWDSAIAALRQTHAELQQARALRAVHQDLEGYAAALGARGFTVTRMPLPAAHVLRRQYYLNAVQIPRAQARPLLIAPAFADAAPEAADADARAARFLEALGYEVVMIPDAAHIGDGNNHCLVRRG